jgi:hypothetical protein
MLNKACRVFFFACATCRVTLYILHSNEAHNGDKQMDMTDYNTNELASSVDLDAYAVRSEATKRAEKASKAIARAKAALAKAESEMAECHKAMKAACQAIAA